MYNDRRLFNWVIVGIVCVVLLLTCMVIAMTRKGDPSIGEFAVDSSGRVYIYYDMRQDIHVYQNGQFLYDYGEMNDMASRTKRGIRFVITEDDEFWMLENDFYALDLDGNLIETASYSQAFQKSSYIGNHNGIYTDAQGNVYKMKGQFLGWTRVVKNDAEVVFQISGLAFFAKLGTSIGVLGFVLSLIAVLRIYWKDRRDFGY